MKQQRVEMPKLHHREPIVQRAHLDLDTAVLDILQRYDLTYAELFRIINEVEAAWIKYAIRDERHPDDPDTPGGWE